MTAVINGGVSVLFLLLWIIVGFFALRWLGQRFFTGQYRAEVFALGVVVAFGLGAVGPFGHRFGGEAAPQAAAPPAAAAPAAPVVAAHDVSAACKAVKTLAGTALGSVDEVGLSVGGKVVPQSAGFTLARNASLGVVGWVADGATKMPATGACLVIDGRVRPEAVVTYGSARPDVANAYSAAAMAGTGYTIVLPAKALAPGTHAITVASITASGAAALGSTSHVNVP